MTAAFDKFRKKISQLSLFDWLAVGLVIIAAVLRLYNLEGSQQFLGDQGRDSMVVADIFRKSDPVFIGPVTSVGNMYLGPLYYYFMLPFLWLSYPSPMGPIYAVAILGTITVGVLYLLGKRVIGERAALVATAFFTFSSAAIVHTRFSWNPNPAPLPGLLMIYFTYLAWKKSPWYWLGVAAMFSILIQLHYVTLLTAGAAGIIWLISLIEKIRQKQSLSELLQSTIGAALIIIVFLLPLILFDLKHGGLNLKAFTEIFTKEDVFDASRPPTFVGRIRDIFYDLRSRASQVLIDTYIGKLAARTAALVTLSLASALWLKNAIQKPNGNVKPHFAAVLLVYILVTVIGITFYSNDVYTHYITFIFPAVFLLFGALADYAIRFNKIIGTIISISVFIVFLYFNFQNMPYHDAGWQLKDISRTADTIAERVDPGEQYNIVLLSETKDLYGQNYRYFLTTKEGREPINPERPTNIDKLFIIDEQKIAENPTQLPIYEIQIFPNLDPVEVYEIDQGPTIYVLEK